MNQPKDQFFLLLTKEKNGANLGASSLSAILKDYKGWNSNDIFLSVRPLEVQLMRNEGGDSCLAFSGVQDDTNTALREFCKA